MQKHPHWRQTLLRTEETANKYEIEIKAHNSKDGCPLCKFEGTLREFNHWVLMENKFPFDRYCTKNHMLVSKRHIAEGQLTPEERAELYELKTNILFIDYDALLETFPMQKSVPEHVNFHLVSFHRVDDQSTEGV